MDYYKLDDKDVVILENLIRDSRIKLNTLAEMLNTSIPTIRSRIDKLEALGIIQQFSIVLSFDLLSEHPIYFVLVKSSPNMVEAIINILNDFHETIEVHELIGSYQILVKTIPLSSKDFQSFISRIRRYEGILDINSLPIATTHKQELGKLPSKDIQVKLRCEWRECNKKIEKNYQTLVINDVTHFFCCKSCLANYENEINQLDLSN